MIYEFYIFNNIGNCLFYLNLSGKVSEKKPQDTQKLIFGMLHTMKLMCRKFSPQPIVVSPFTSYATDSYKLHILETGSGLNLVMLTSPEMMDQTHSLKWIYSTIFCTFIVRSPFYEPKKPINSTVFKQKLEEYLQSLAKY
jgi:trafficking protein particle complex subunit 1